MYVKGFFRNSFNVKEQFLHFKMILSHSNRILGSKVILNFTSSIILQNNKKQKKCRITISFVFYCFSPSYF